MRSAIGDFYVHLHAINYNRAGIYRLREGRREAYNYQNKISEVNKKLPAKRDNAELEKNLQRLMGKGNPEESQQKINEVRRAIEKMLGDDFQETIKNIDWNKLNISKENLQQEKGSIISKIRADSNKDYIYLKTIMARVRAIEDLQTNIGSAIKREKLQKLLNQIYREIATILNVSGSITTVQELKTMNIVQENAYNPKIKWDKRGINLVQLINETIKLYAVAPLISMKKGRLLEYAISGAWILAQIDAGKKVDDIVEAIRRQVTGQRESQIKIDFTKLGVSADVSMHDIELKGYIVDGYRKVAMAVLPSQEKVDIQIDFTDSGQAISAKNINLALGYNISLVSGSPLSYLIQDEDDDFKGHYLNLVATHADKTQIKQNISLAHNAMKYVLLFKAIAGGTFGREKYPLVLL